MAEELGQTDYRSQLEQLSSTTLEEFKVRLQLAIEHGQSIAIASIELSHLHMFKFDEVCRDTGIELNESTLNERSVLWHNMQTLACTEKSCELMLMYEEKLSMALSKPVQSLLKDANDQTWPTIRKLLQLEKMTTLVGFISTISSYGTDQTTIETFVAKLERHAIRIVESKAREEAAKVLLNMKDRFETMFSYDSDSIPRLWTGKEDIKTITRMARLASLKLLAVLAVIRLGENTDNVEDLLQLALMDGLISSTSNRNLSSNTLIELNSNKWGDVPSTSILITPVQCKILWRKFMAKTDDTVRQAIVVQETKKRNSNSLPPPWAIAAMLFLGLNEFKTLVRNPLYLWVIFVAFLLGKTLWVQYDISGEFRNGALIGILSLFTKFFSTLVDILKKQSNQGQRVDSTESYNTSLSSSAGASNETSDSAAELRFV